MIVVYKPDNADEVCWDLDEVKPTFAEAKAAEHAGGFAWQQLRAEIDEGNLSALQAVVWVLRKRAEPTLKFDDLDDLPLGSVETRYSEVEKEFMRDHIKADKSLSADERKATLALLGIEEKPPAAKPRSRGKG